MDSRHYGAIGSRGVSKTGKVGGFCDKLQTGWLQLVGISLGSRNRREKWSSFVALSSSNFSEVKILFYNFIIVRKYHDAGIPCILYSC